jgi:hypothetical protein
MSDPLLEEDDASTPLTVEEREGLIPSYVTLRRELNEADRRTFWKPSNGRSRERATCSTNVS